MAAGDHYGRRSHLVEFRGRCSHFVKIRYLQAGESSSFAHIRGNHIGQRQQQSVEIGSRVNEPVDR